MSLSQNDMGRAFEYGIAMELSNYLPVLVKERQTFISYSVNPLTLQPLPKIKTQKAIIKELQLAFSKEVMPYAVKQETRNRFVAAI